MAIKDIQAESATSKGNPFMTALLSGDAARIADALLPAAAQLAELDAGDQQRAWQSAWRRYQRALVAWRHVEEHYAAGAFDAPETLIQEELTALTADALDRARVQVLNTAAPGIAELLLKLDVMIEHGGDDPAGEVEAGLIVELAKDARRLLSN